MLPGDALQEAMGSDVQLGRSRQQTCMHLARVYGQIYTLPGLTAYNSNHMEKLDILQCRFHGCGLRFLDFQTLFGHLLMTHSILILETMPQVFFCTSGRRGYMARPTGNYTVKSILTTFSHFANLCDGMIYRLSPQNAPFWLASRHLVPSEQYRQFRGVNALVRHVQSHP